MTDKDHNTSHLEFPNGSGQIKDRLRPEKNLPEGAGAASGPKPENEELESLGDRVRKIREEKGLTLADVASRTGFDEAFLKRIETDEVSPPLGELIKLGKALNMKMGYFISGGETKPYTIVRQEHRQKIARRAATEDQAYGYSYQALAPNKTDRHMEPFLVTLEPAAEEKLSTHEGQEFIFVLTGKMEAILDRDRIILEPGDAIYYDSKVPHQVRCVDGPQAQILAVLYNTDQ